MANKLNVGLGGVIPGCLGAQAAKRQSALLAELDACFAAADGPTQPKHKPALSLDPMNEDMMDLCRSWSSVDQGDVRNTCVAFSTLALIELYERIHQGKSTFSDYSEEFLYAKMRVDHKPAPDELPNNYDEGGTFLEQAVQALEISGVCMEDTMPYVKAASRPDALTTPTDAAVAEALDHRVPKGSLKELRLCAENPGDWRKVPILKTVRRALQMGSPVVVSFPVYGASNEWSNRYGSGWRYGHVLDPLAPSDVVSVFEDNTVEKKVRGGHAVCIVGFLEGTDGQDGRFVFKNSWGHRFAKLFEQSPVTPPDIGYGTVSQTHVANHCWELMYRDPQVS